jgi:type III secretion protein SpaR/YscT/HrcT
MVWSGVTDDTVRWLLGVTLGGMRAFGILQVMPLFAWMRISGPVRLAVALGLGLGLASSTSPREIDTLEIDWIQLTLLGAKEAAVGAGLGALLSLPLWAAQAAGDVIDTQRGANMQSAFDPVSAPDVTTGGRLFLCLAMVWFASFGGFELLAETLDKSFAVWPVDAFWPGRAIGDLAPAGAAVVEILRSAALLAAPLIIVSLIVDAAFAVNGRLSERIPLDAARDGAKSVLFLVLLPIYVTYFPGIMSQHAMTGLRQALGFLDMR